MLETDGKATDCYPYPLHLSTAGDSINRLRPLVKFQPVRLVNFRPAPTAEMFMRAYEQAPRLETAVATIERLAA